MTVNIFEAAAIAAIFLLLIQSAFLANPPLISWSLIGLSAALLLIGFGINPARWQLVPALLALLIIAAQTLLTMHSGNTAGMHVWALASCAILLALSAALAWGMPAGALPAPEGPFKVGTITTELTRTPSPAEEPPRHLTIKVWYPAASSAKAGKLDSLWNELPSIKEMPALARGLLAYMGRIKTHSILNAPSASGRQYPLLIYNHSLISFASENTLLMEWLASRGYVVVSLRHREQAEEYAAIQKGISEDEQARDRELTSRLRKTLTRKERAELSLMQFENSSGVSMIVKRRAEDSAFVLANLSQVLTRIPGASDDSIAPDFGALGLSLGGAVATRFCLAEPRCAGVANLDGGLYGLDKSRLLRSPYLMIYSQDNAGTNDAFVQGTEGYQELVLQGAKHLDLQDASVVLPILKWFGMLGAGSGKAKNHRMKAAVASFFDRALKPPISG